MILSVPEMRALEESAFGRGISAESLMDEAGAGVAAAVREFWPRPGACLVLFGKGNNGGDALVAARHLASAGWETHLVPAYPPEAWGELPRRKFEEAGLGRHYPPGLTGWEEAAGAVRGKYGRPLIVLEGLLGMGAKGALREPIAGLVAAVNRLRSETPAQVVALDLPTGLESGGGEEGVVADFTVAIGACKQELVADGAAARVGRLVLIPLRELAQEPAPAGREVAATAPLLAGRLKRRPFEMHKGDCDRVAIVAGSVGLTGAARLCAEACVRAGAGLVTLHVDSAAYPIVAASAAPEVMVKEVSSYLQALEAKPDVLALGPGLGLSLRGEVLELIRQSEVPTVIDADGLNALAGQHLELLAEGPAPRLLTPHPGEMARLDRAAPEKSRREAARDFVARFPVTLLLKGARTVVAKAGQPLSYNTTGHPGMATGGMGDVLTGVCAALAGQGLALYEAAQLGAWLCGRAAELAVMKAGESEESLTPTALMGSLGSAFTALRARGF